MNNIKDDAMSRYVINFEEFMAIFSKDFSDMIAGQICNYLSNQFSIINVDLSTIKISIQNLEEFLLNNKYIDITKKINVLLGSRYSNPPKTIGKMSSIPAIISDYTIDFIFNISVFIIGIHINQTGWKKEDDYSLIINNDVIIDCSKTKEIGEHKYFVVGYEVNPNTQISIVYHNRSGNSKQLMFNLDYIEL